MSTDSSPASDCTESKPCLQPVLRWVHSESCRKAHIKEGGKCSYCGYYEPWRNVNPQPFTCPHSKCHAALHAAEAEAKRLREMLERLEWSFRQTSLRNGGTIYTATLCPACMGEKDPPDDKGSRRMRGDPLPPAGHRPGCWLRAALKGPDHE